jgi:hypothetical protein
MTLMCVRMTSELRDEALDAFRDAALQRGIRSTDVERWITATARPCAILSGYGGGGSVVYIPPGVTLEE